MHGVNAKVQGVMKSGCLVGSVFEESANLTASLIPRDLSVVAYSCEFVMRSDIPYALLQRLCMSLSRVVAGKYPPRERTTVSGRRLSGISPYLGNTYISRRDRRSSVFWGWLPSCAEIVVAGRLTGASHTRSEQPF